MHPLCTPYGLQAAGDDTSFCRRDRGAATGPGMPAGGSPLDQLLSSALGEAPAVQQGPLPGPQPATAPAAPAAPVCPGAPRRNGPLPPPPEVPACVLAALRPLRFSAHCLAAPSTASSSSGDGEGGDGDTATSRASQLEL